MRPFLYMGFMDKYNYIHESESRNRFDCSKYDIAGLSPLPLSVIKAFDGVSAALQSIKLQHCVCSEWALNNCVSHEKRKERERRILGGRIFV